MTADNVLTLGGEAMSIADWALEYGIFPSLILERLERGWSAERAITKPMFALPGQKLPKKSRPNRAGGTRTGRQLVHGSEALTVRQWSERTGIHTATINYRLRTGNSVAEALGMVGVANVFPVIEGTGGGSVARDIPEIEFSK